MTVQIHPQALCESASIGAGTCIGAFAHVWPGARIGADCEIGDGVSVDDDVVIGDRVVIDPGVTLWAGTRLEDDVRVGPNATFSRTRSSRQPSLPDGGHTRVQQGARIGASATLASGIGIGIGAVVEDGAVVLRSVPAHAIVAGNPAQIVGYTHTAQVGISPRGAADVSVAAGTVRGVRLLQLTQAVDLRGSLAAAETGRELPFVPQRCFLVYAVPNAEVRGEHAHRRCAQVLICVHGQISALVDDGAQRAEYRLDRPDQALYVPPMVWGTQYRYSADAVLLVLASERYDAADYIRDYGEFQSLLTGTR